MKFSNKDIPYLKGEYFSNGRKFQVARKNESNINRLDFLEAYSLDKNVLHIGFADHIPLIEDKIRKNQWLHNRLIANSNLCVGIDLNLKALDFLKEKIGIENVYCLDILNEQLPPQILDKSFDIVIVGEVLEHIDNPVNFLETIQSKLGSISKELIITVPNALDITNIKMIKKGIEWINTDHRYWFTPFTLGKVLHQGNFTIKKFFYSQTFLPTNKVDKSLIKRYPMLRETIIAISDF